MVKSKLHGATVEIDCECGSYMYMYVVYDTGVDLSKILGEQTTILEGKGGKK